MRHLGAIRATQRCLRDDGPLQRVLDCGRRTRRAAARNTCRGRMIERVKSAMVGLGATWVLLLMLVLSVVSLAIMLERAWLYWSLRDDAAALMRDLGRLLREGDLDGARRRLE